MSDHVCPTRAGLRVCISHPKWHVLSWEFGTDGRDWAVYEPCGEDTVAVYPTWRDAFDCADKLARGRAV